MQTDCLRLPASTLVRSLQEAWRKMVQVEEQQNYFPLRQLV
uniref:Uncharacterized protein n=1 Tax=Arundo donax TaxID=35708 RepID=A0A0A9D6F5_ARUDO